jgi:hypothetical protein
VRAGNLLRRKHGELTRAKMAAAAPLRADLTRRQDAWALACPEARRRFLAGLCDAGRDTPQ